MYHCQKPRGTLLKEIEKIYNTLATLKWHMSSGDSVVVQAIVPNHWFFVILWLLLEVAGQNIQCCTPNAAKLTGLHITVQMIQNTLQKQPKSFPCQRNGIFFNGDGSHMISIQQKAFKLLNINLNVETHNQEASEGDCSKALAEHLEGENTAYHDVHGF